MKGRSASKIKLTSYDELLGGGEETNDIQQVSLEHLHSFENHPFQVNLSLIHISEPTRPGTVSRMPSSA